MFELQGFYRKPGLTEADLGVARLALATEATAG